MILNGPMFEPAQHNGMKSVTGKGGAHYNVYYLDVSPDGRSGCPEAGMRSLRQIFPTGEANELNLALFSTSGVHGTYTTIEEIEVGLEKYGDDGPDDEDAEDWHGNTLTVLVIHPRIVCLRCGNVRVRRADIDWLKTLRASSWKVAQVIGS